MRTRIKWTPEMIEELRRDYSENFNSDLALRFGVSEKSVWNQASRHGFNEKKCGYYKRNRKKGVNRKWNEKNIEFLKMNYKNVSALEISNILGFTINAIRSKASVLGITNICGKTIGRKRKSSFRKYNFELIEKVDKLRENHTDKEVAKILEINFYAVSKLKTKNKPIEALIYCDKNIASCLTNCRRGTEKEIELREEYLNHPHLIELKRNQLLLNRELKKLSNG